MFYTHMYGQGEEPVLYRSPYEIRRDIGEINQRIKDTDEKINVRILLTDLLSRCADGRAEEYMPELRQAIKDAEGVLSHLSELCQHLVHLKKEMEDTVWALGI